MALSNYGPHVDPNAPLFIQNLYAGKSPDFVFEATDPSNKTKKIFGAFNLVFNVAIFGFVIWSLIHNAAFLEGLNTPEFWEKMKTEFIDTTDEDTRIFLGIGILFGAVFLLSIMIGMVRDLVRTFKTEKLWYISTPAALTVVRGSKSFDIRWDNFAQGVEHASGPMGDTLTFKFVPGFMPPPILGSRPKLGNIMAAFNTMTIINPPNIMEVKRLSEKRIMEANPPPSFKKLKNPYIR